MMEIVNELILSAKAARENAYAPYSGFRVGAAVLCEDGRIFSGANVENASYGLTICAERSAIFSAISSRCRKIKMLVVAAEKPTFPCGACRQVLAEFADKNTSIIIVGVDTGEMLTSAIGELLPNAFDFRKKDEK